MWNTTNVLLLRDRLDLLTEVESIGETIAVFEQQYGAHADLDDLRQRVQAVRVTVLEQLRGLLAWNTETFH
jgi:hypothetical protein